MYFPSPYVCLAIIPNISVLIFSNQSPGGRLLYFPANSFYTLLPWLNIYGIAHHWQNKKPWKFFMHIESACTWLDDKLSDMRLNKMIQNVYMQPNRPNWQNNLIGWWSSVTMVSCMCKRLVLWRKIYLWIHIIWFEPWTGNCTNNIKFNRMPKNKTNHQTKQIYTTVSY